MFIGKNLRKLRKEKGLTQSQLAQISGVSRNAIINYESDKRYPNLEILTKLSDALDVEIGSLFINQKTIIQDKLIDLLEGFPAFSIKEISDQSGVCEYELTLIHELGLPSNLDDYFKFLKYCGFKEDDIVISAVKDGAIKYIAGNKCDTPLKNLLFKYLIEHDEEIENLDPREIFETLIEKENSRNTSDTKEKNNIANQLVNMLDNFITLFDGMNIKLSFYMDDNAILRVKLIDNKDGYTKIFNTLEEAELFFDEIKHGIQSSVDRLKYFDKKL